MSSSFFGSSASSSNTNSRVFPTQALNLAGPVLRVCVGTSPNDESFFVHQKLLVSRSEFFARAMNGKWRESDEGVVPLPDDQPEIFSLYANLLYTDRLATRQTDPEKKADEFTLLARLYVLAEKLQDVKAKNDIIDAMLAKSRAEGLVSTKPPLTMDAVAALYEGTPEGSQARKLFVDFFAQHGLASWLGEKEDVRFDFLYDVSVRLLQIRTKGTIPMTTANCPLAMYHEGEDRVEGKAATASTLVPTWKKKHQF